MRTKQPLRRRKDVTNLHFRNMMTALALGAAVMALAAPASAADTAAADTSVVSATAVQSGYTSAAIVGAEGDTSALRGAVDAVMPQVAEENGSTNGSATAHVNAVADTNSTANAGMDYVSLESPAAVFDGIEYVPLRSTLAAMKNNALAVTWKVDGQNKIMLTNGSQFYEVYLSDDGSSIHLSQGDAGWPFKNVNGVVYVPLSFFQNIIGSATVGLSGDNLLILVDKDGGDVWANGQAFWQGMAAYQRPAAPEPAPAPAPAAPAIKNVTAVKVPVPAATPSATPSTNAAASNAAPNAAPSSGATDDRGVPLIPDTLIWPTSATYVSSPYGPRVDPVSGTAYDFHLGVDIAAAVGTPIYAAQGGTVTFVQQWDGSSTWGMMSYGNCIDITHPSGLVTRYAHLSQINVTEGQTVTQGQVIALMGASGNVTGPHLHFETIINSVEVDPKYYIHY